MKTNSFFPLLFVCMIPLCMSCRAPNQPSDSGPNNCNELAGTQSSPVTLNQILCTAQDSSGVVYVVDSYQSCYRLFISKGDTLYRKEVIGSSVMMEQYYFLSIEDSIQFIFQNHSSVWTDAFMLKGNCKECDSILNNHMTRDPKSINNIALGWTDLCLFLKSRRPNTASLAMATVNDTKKYTLKNFPPTTHIEYVAQQSSGQYILVTRPYYDWNGDVVVHYGLPNNLLSCQVIGILRASDGGSTWITFKVGSKSYEAFFGVILDTTGVRNGKSWLRIDTDTLNLNRKSTDIQTLNSIGFNCSITLK